MLKVMWVGLGGAMGAMLRYGVHQWIHTATATRFPVGTLVVNVVGCLAIGVLAGAFELLQRDGVRLFWVVGVLGGFTTFSAFGMETVALLKTRPGAAILYVAASVVIGVLAVFGGYAMGQGLAATV